MRVLITGATGFIGGRLARRLLDDGFEVRCLVRNREDEAARALEQLGAELAVADITRPVGLRGALDRVEAAYFLVHMIGDGEEYPAIERAAAVRFARAAKAAGVRRMLYLGGLGERAGSRHLSARRETAAALAAEGPPLTYFRAAMVIGAGSESYELLRALVTRLPVVPVSDALATRTQPIGVDDVISYLRAALDVPESAGREIQIGGPDVLSHLEVVREMASALGRRGPIGLAVSAEIARPRTIAAGAAALTPGSPAVAAELSFGLGEETVVNDGSGAELFAIRPRPLAQVLAAAVDGADAAQAVRG